MSKTNGQMDAGATITIGAHAEIEGYVVPTVSEAFTGDLIDIYVMEGEEAESLFVVGSCSVTSFTEGWTVTVSGETEKKDGFSKFELYCEDSEVKKKPVHFCLSGTVNGKTGVTKICLKENTTEVETGGSGKENLDSGPEITEQYVLKKKSEPSVKNFIAARATEKMKLRALFEPGEPIYFSWESGMGFYQLYRGDMEHLIYEGTESNFEYPFGIFMTATFILKASFTDNEVRLDSARCCYETLTLNTNCLGIPLNVKGVEDGEGASFLFTQYDSKYVDYIWITKDNEEKFQKGGLELIGEQLYADRLKDGRIVVLTVYGTKVYFQIQDKMGEPGFQPVKELTRETDQITYIFTLHMECDKNNALYVAVEAYGKKCERRCIYLAKLVTGEEKLSFWYQLEDNNDQEGIRVDTTSAWICDSHGAATKICVYDLTKEVSEKTDYKGGGQISHTVKDLKSDGAGGLYCQSRGGKKGMSVFRFLFLSDEKTYSLREVDADNLYYDIGISSLGTYCLAVRSNNCLYSLFETTPGTYREEYISSIIEKASIVKYRSGPPIAACLSQNNKKFLLRYKNSKWSMKEY